MKDNKSLMGRWTLLTELNPHHFEKIVQWRNDRELNRYINQPFELTMELEEKWYRESYCNDDSQLLYVMLDKEKGKPFGTIGYVGLDMKEKSCIFARLMAGERAYQGSPYLIEGLVLFFDYLYYDLELETIYSHVVCKNLASLRIQKRFGFQENNVHPNFPERLHDSIFPMVEIVERKKCYESERWKIMKVLEDIM